MLLIEPRTHIQVTQFSKLELDAVCFSVRVKGNITNKQARVVIAS